MIITTAGRTNKEMTTYARRVADELNGTFVKRNDATIHDMHTKYEEDILVAGKNRLEMYPRGGDSSFFFHPNSASFRIKRLMRGEHDPFVQATGLQAGMTFLDCTLGMASDSIVASYITKEAGRVVGTEANRYMAYIVEKGLLSWQSDIPEINEAMHRVTVMHTEHLTYLQTCETDSFDVVYFDPMFEESILESDGLKGLKRYALYDDIIADTIEEALRVAKQRVVLKDHFRSERFTKYGFTPIRRKTAKFHFGVREI
ncbi:class I SAM-dependent methyltransferase [Ectobacillus antri]|uniref:Class I SAM-dependent methyltransferase n=1 Tax=Ectobacillus antri TaxID=2486280 RepID=A0ABT6H2X1_9BACI|nr:class I SAM-dependent methyltransferase [Ectobacillus antri]MDG4656300.1 class I SAM-dependent methyltransferase [Ectobacillus antri]MDG5752975.1 class I SAM-dependent methyltransferase [Ectobacillus antri]